jgi:hypothetical protein
MDNTGLPSALRACAHGIYALEAAAELIIEHATWLGRDDFIQLIHTGPGSAATMAAIDWPAATAAIDADVLPCSGGERKMLELAASLAGQRPVVLGDAIAGLDERSVQVLLRAVLHASGRRRGP